MRFPVSSLLFVSNSTGTSNKKNSKKTYLIDKQKMYTLGKKFFYDIE